MMAEQWRRLSHGVHSKISIYENGAVRFGNHLVVQLPAHIRLCERVEDDRPHPDWSRAPSWAMWWAVDADGKVYWYEDEPSICSIVRGVWRGKDGRVAHLCDSGTVEIPLGCDWRTCIEQRPEAGADE